MPDPCPNCGYIPPPEWKAAVRQHAAWAAMVELGQEMYDIGAMVCVKHLRFVPCRHGKTDSPCQLSENPEDIGYVVKYQRGEVD